MVRSGWTRQRATMCVCAPPEWNGGSLKYDNPADRNLPANHCNFHIANTDHLDGPADFQDAVVERIPVRIAAVWDVGLRGPFYGVGRFDFQQRVQMAHGLGTVEVDIICGGVVPQPSSTKAVEEVVFASEQAPVQGHVFHEAG